MTRRPLPVRAVVAGATLVILSGCNDRGGSEPTSRALPAPILGGRVFTDLALGDFHSCGLTPEGEAFCWGGNSQGQSGNGLNPDESIGTPMVVIGGFVFNSLVAGGAHTCGLLVNGNAVCWGNNVAGQLGTGNTITRGEPTAVAGGHTFTSLTASTFAHTCGLDQDGIAWCWGDNEFGQLGDGTLENRSTPVAVAGNLVFTSLTAGGGHTCGLVADGTAYCWGYNVRGQLGNNSEIDSAQPVAVATSLKFKQVAAGLSHTCALTMGNEAYCWGDNIAGALGNESFQSEDSPVPVSGSNEYASITVGERHACGITVEGGAVCWGYNLFGTLGDGTFIQAKPFPVVVNTPVAFKKVVAGGYHNCALSQSNVTYCWGENSLHQLGAQ